MTHDAATLVPAFSPPKALERGPLRGLDAVVGLGTNLGDRRAALAEAVRALGLRGRITALSPVFETAPVGPPQPDYLNAAVRLIWPGDPRSLLDACLAIEVDLGRVRRERWGARTLDLDVLWVRGVALDEPSLTVPHPRLAERAFALLPLFAVAPDARDPRTGAPFAEPSSTEGVRRTEPLLRASR